MVVTRTDLLMPALRQLEWWKLPNVLLCRQMAWWLWGMPRRPGQADCRENRHCQQQSRRLYPADPDIRAHLRYAWALSMRLDNALTFLERRSHEKGWSSAFPIPLDQFQHLCMRSLQRLPLQATGPAASAQRASAAARGEQLNETHCGNNVVCHGSFFVVRNLACQNGLELLCGSNTALARKRQHHA